MEQGSVDQNRQYNVSVVHQQAGWQEISLTHDSRYDPLEMVSKGGLTLVVRHIPGIENSVAALESRRTFTTNAWQISPSVFTSLIDPD